MKATEHNEFAAVVRTARGLSIAGTRITLYNIVEYLEAGWTPQRIQETLQLSDAQINDVTGYLSKYRQEVEKEYQQVVQRAEENRKYWEAKKQAHLAKRKTALLTPEQMALRAKFEKWRSKTKAA